MNCLSEISAFANIHAQLASIMEILTRSAVTEISKLVKDSSEVLLLEMCRRQNENDSLKRKLEWMETELRTARRREARESFACSRTVGVQAGVGVRGAERDKWHSERRATPTELVFEKRGPRLGGSVDPSLSRAGGSPVISVVQSVQIDTDRPGPVVIKQESLEDEFEDIEPQRRLVIITADDPEEQGVDPSPAGGSEELKEPDDGKLQLIQGLNEADSQHLRVTFSLDSVSHDTYERDAHLWTSPIQRDSETETDDPDFPYDAEQDVPDEMELQQIPVAVDSPSRVEVKPCLRMLSVVPKKEEGTTHVNTAEGAQLVLIQSHQMEHRGRIPSVMTGDQMTEEVVSQPSQRVQRSPGTVPGSKDKSGHTFTGSHVKMTKKMKSLRRPPKGEQQISCTQCGKSFTTRFYLKIHQRIHTGERPFSCTQCGKSFYCTSHLISHQRSHTGEKPYRCHECGNSYSHLNSLKLHHKVHRQERLFSST